MLRPSLLSASIALVCGCANHNVRGIDEAPEKPAGYSALYFSSPSTERVLVTSVMKHSLLGDHGLAVQNGAVMPEPLWLWPGWWQVTYACPNNQSLFTTTIGLSQHGKYFLHCGADGKLLASRNVEP